MILASEMMGQNVCGASLTPTPAVQESSRGSLGLIILLMIGLVFLTVVMIVVVAAVLKKFKNIS